MTIEAFDSAFAVQFVMPGDVHSSIDQEAWLHLSTVQLKSHR